MEQLAAFVGWIDTKDTIINLNTGMTIEAVEDSGTGKIVVTLPSGDELDFEGDDAAAILDRAELFASIGDSATRLIKATAERAATAES